MSVKRQKHSSQFKAKVALSAIRNEKTLAQMSKEFGVNANLISKWKSQLLERAKDLFEGHPPREVDDELVSKLYQQIGEQKVELDWLKKKSGIDR